MRGLGASGRCCYFVHYNPTGHPLSRTGAKDLRLLALNLTTFNYSWHLSLASTFTFAEVASRSIRHQCPTQHSLRPWRAKEDQVPRLREYSSSSSSRNARARYSADDSNSKLQIQTLPSLASSAARGEQATMQSNHEKPITTATPARYDQAVLGGARPWLGWQRFFFLLLAAKKWIKRSSCRATLGILMSSESRSDFKSFSSITYNQFSISSLGLKP